MTPQKTHLASLETEICQVARTEGIGSIYERLMLKRFFEKLASTYHFNSVLEYQGLNITKGLDNLIFLNQGKKVTLYDKNIKSAKTNWPFTLKPQFASSSPKEKRFDLVWNFAVIQLQPQIVDRMIALSRKFILIFTPNVFNFGLPVHQLYHLLTRTSCRHAERGSIYLRTPWGIRQFARHKGIRLITAGFIDLPLLPDIGFSLAELKTRLGLKSSPKSTSSLSPQFTSKLKFLNTLEKLSLPPVIQFPFAHHIYLLGQVK